MIIRDATRKDLLSFYGKLPSESVRARVAELDGEIIGIIGISYGQVPLFFSDIKPEMRSFKMTIVREAKKFMETLKNHGQGAYAQACPDESLSERLIEMLGFTYVYETKFE